MSEPREVQLAKALVDFFGGEGDANLLEQSTAVLQVKPVQVFRMANGDLAEFSIVGWIEDTDETFELKVSIRKIS